MHFRIHGHRYVVAGVIILAVSAGAFYFLDLRHRAGTPAISNGETNAGTTTAPAANKGSSGGKTAASLPPYTGEPIRAFPADPKRVAAIGDAVFKNYQNQLDDIAARLEKDPKNYDDWLAVAYIKNIFDDRAGMRDAWEYAKIVDPKNPIAYFNLGELYGYDLHDTAKAEENYLMALQLNPLAPDYYTGLANFYVDAKKDPARAEATLLKGVGTIVDVNLFSATATFYRNQGNTAKAIEYFQKALSTLSSEDAGLRATIQKEIDALRAKQR